MSAVRVLGNVVLLGLLGLGRAVGQAALVVATSADGRPVEGALVSIRDTTGQTLRRTATGEGGRVLVPVKMGRYIIRVDAIGFEGSEQEATVVGGTMTLSFALRHRPYNLSEIQVRGSEAILCRQPADRASLLGAVWSDIYSSLSLGGVAAGRPNRLARGKKVERDLNLAHRVLKEEKVELPSGYYAPFFAIDPDDLHRAGYVQSNDGVTSYFAPDASFLLSESFQRDHCFSVEASPGDRQVRLSFRPAPGRQQPDIAGTLFVETLTGRLQRLEYRYVNVRLPLGTKQVGGCVQFINLDRGPVTVRSWSIRMPVIASISVPPWGQRDSLVGYREVAGAVEMVDQGLSEGSELCPGPT